MRTDRGQKIWDRWDVMVKASKDAEEDFNDFMDDNAIIQADRKIKSLRSKLKASQDECEELKKMQDHLKWKDETRKQLKVSREEIDQLKAEVKKKKNRIGILNRSLRRLKKE